MNATATDASDPIVIIGGGPTGLTCALLLARAGLRCVVIDARAIEQAQQDRRLLALARGTWQVLKPLLTAQPLPTAPISKVLVSSASEFGVTRLTTQDGAKDFGADALGATVFYGDLLTALERAVQAEPRIEQQRPVRVLDVQQHPRHVDVLLENSTLRASIAIDAEGAPRDVTATAVALIGDLEIIGPQPGQAFERFTRDGPLALLPTPAQQSTQSNNSAPVLSLVWCMPSDIAARRRALSADALLAELQQSIGRRIGTARRFVAPLRTMPLVHQLRERVQEHRRIALGNAAQALHPVAGQGFNLAVRDCATLVRLLSDYPNEPLRALQDYAQARRSDRTVISTVTRWLPSMFASRFMPIAVARSWGLTALDLSPLLRRELAHLLMFGVRHHT